jgi:hypothetical protein
MNSLIPIAAALVFISYALIPKRPLQGWAVGVLGNGLYIAAFMKYHQIELLIAPIGFTVLSAWNVWQELRKIVKP